MLDVHSNAHFHLCSLLCAVVSTLGSSFEGGINQVLFWISEFADALGTKALFDDLRDPNTPLRHQLDMEMTGEVVKCFWCIPP